MASTILSDPRQVRQALDRYRRLRARVAREDPNELNEYVLRDEKTGRPVVQAPLHEAMQRAYTRHRRVIFWSHVGAGKTQQALGRVLFELGRNPKLRVLVAASTFSQSAKTVNTIATYIEQSQELREVFPHLKRGEKKSDRWQHGMITVNRPGNIKDPSVWAIGTDTQSVLGARVDLAILDDILNLENTRTPEQRQKLHEWYHANIVSRLEEGARVWFVGTAFHPDDLLHQLSRTGKFVYYRYPVIDPATGQSNWPEGWPLSRIEERRQETTPHEFARTMLCQPLDDAEARFKKEWINQCLDRGDGKTPAYALRHIPHGYRVYTGVDLGTRQHSKSDLTVLFTIIVHPNEDREILNIESGRWSGGDIVDRIIDCYNRYQGVVIVENVAAQQFILDFTKKVSAVPVLPFNTQAKHKLHPEFGVEGLAAEMANSKWIIPSNNRVPANKEIGEFINEMLFYDPKAHTGDRLMAAWFAREAARVKPRRFARGRIDLMSR